MIESGTHTSGVSADDFGLPPRAALRYERPRDDLLRYFGGYAVLDSEEDDENVTWMLPGWAQIWIVITDRPIGVKIGNRSYSPMPQASLYGVTSRAMPVSTHGGVTVAIDITPLGWARLFNRSADLFGDRLVRLDTMLSPALVETLVARLKASDLGGEVKGVLDTFLAEAMGPPHPDEATIARVLAMLDDREIADPAAMAVALGIEPAALRRLTKRHFGFPPKILKMRSRFMRAFVPMKLRGSANDFARVPARYHDVSHFIRDGRRFLTMTPRRFAMMATPYLDAVLRARALVLGLVAPRTSELAPTPPSATVDA